MVATPQNLTTHLMTAGLVSDDYRFLGRVPREAFWRRYADYSSFERPTAILLCREGAFRAYVSGIASARRDRTKTPLRYTLVLEGPCRTPAAEAVLFALSAFVEDLAGTKPGPVTAGTLGRALDETFPEPFVEAALRALRDAQGQAGGPLAEVEARTARAVESLPRNAPCVTSDLRFFWGGRASAAARARWLGHAERLLLDGEPGSALAVNLASRDHLELLGAGEASCAVLFAGEDGEEAFADPLEWPPKKGRPGSPKGLPRAIDLREAQAEPGLSIPRLGQMLLGALRTVRDFFLGRRRASS
jgi:hypothetical protein